MAGKPALEATRIELGALARDKLSLAKRGLVL